MTNKKGFSKVAVSSMAAAAAVTAVAPAVSADSGVKNAEDFTDVTKDNVFYNGVQWMVDQGIEGKADGSFGVWEDVSREQSVIFFTNVLGLDLLNKEDASKYFNDVDADTLYAEYIATVGKAGIFSGDEDGNFFTSGDPRESLTREQMATTIVEAFDLQSDGNHVDMPWNKEFSASHRNNVQILADLGITNQTAEKGEEGYFRPGEAISRGQFSQMLMLAAEAAEDQEEKDLAIDSVNASANDNHTVSVTGEVTNAERVTVTIDGVEKTADLKDNGNFSYTSDELETGSYKVTVTAHNGDDSVSEETQVAVVDEQTSVAGFVLDSDNGGVAGAKVLVDGEDVGVTTNSHGFYQIKNLDSDSFYDLTIQKPEHETQEERVRVEKERTSTVVTNGFSHFTQADIEISGKVVDAEEGGALDGADVVLEAYSEELGEWIAITDMEDVTTDSEGKYSFDQGDVDPDNFLEFGEDYRVAVTEDMADYYAGNQEVTVNENKQVTQASPVELAPIMESTVTGKVTRDGSAVQNATVELGDFTADTNANGNYKFDEEKVPAGDYNLTVKYTDGAGEDTVSTEAITIGEDGGSYSQNLELDLGAKFTFKLGAPVSKTIEEASLSAEVYNEDGALVANDISVTKDDSNMDFEFDNNLSAGDYTVHVSGKYVVGTDYSFSVSKKDVADYIDNDTAKDVSGEQYEAVLGGNLADILGSVNGEVDNSTKGDSVVVVRDNNGDIVNRSIAADTGSFGGVATGKHTVDVYKPGYVLDKSESKKTSFTVQENKDVSGFDFEMVVPNNEATVDGKVRDASSLDPIDDASVSFYQDGSLVEQATASEYENGVTLAPGNYTVVTRDHVDGDANNEEYVTDVQQLTLNSKEEVENHHVDLEGGSAQIDLSVVDGANKALKADNVTVYDAWADRSSSDEEAGITSFTGTDAELIDNLSPGEFDIRVGKAGYDGQSLSASLDKNQDLKTKVVMSESDATYEVNASVVEEGTDKQLGVDKVAVFDSEGNMFKVNNTGSFELPNGDYTVSAYKGGSYVGSEKVTVDRKDVNKVIQVEEGNW